MQAEIVVSQCVETLTLVPMSELFSTARLRPEYNNSKALEILSEKTPSVAFASRPFLKTLSLPALRMSFSLNFLSTFVFYSLSLAAQVRASKDSCDPSATTCASPRGTELFNASYPLTLKSRPKPKVELHSRWKEIWDLQE